MTKFIGTGKDVRAPEGTDFDIPDARPHEQQLVEDSGVGTRVAPGDEAYAVHRGYDLIAEEGGTPDVAGKSGEEIARGTGGVEGDPVGDHADRAAARVETTAADPSGSSDDADGDADDGLSDNLSRDELNSRAEEAGVEDPQSLPNKGAVIQAIRDADSGSDSE